MLHPKLLHPTSIAVIGASDNLQTPGGKVLYNLISHDYKGKLYGVNPKFSNVQGITCFQEVSQLPRVEMAIIAVAAKYCEKIVEILTKTKNTKAFIIFSAGFSEHDEAGKILENKLLSLINNVEGTLLGPNNIGMINSNFAGVFTTPIPKLDPKGVDFISGSGATAVFILEAAMDKGLTFNSIFSVGNSAQIGVEEILEHLDETYIHKVSSPIKLLYIESIQNPQKLLKHARSLREKGAKLAAIKAGSSEAGSRAASSHTGAIANVDTAVDALFQKAGIIRCFGREELVNVAGVLTYPSFKGKNIAIITHAGGPAVMLTDVLSKGGLHIPKITNNKSNELLNHLFAGSSVSNPIDFLATGTAEQLGIIIDYCNQDFEEIDAMAVIFGSPGLFGVKEVYNLLEQKILSSPKPIFPILPSVINVAHEIKSFTNNGHFAFFDEVNFGAALSKVVQNQSYYDRINPASMELNANNDSIDGFFLKNKTNEIFFDENIQKLLQKEINGLDGYLSPDIITRLFEILKIPIVLEQIVSQIRDLNSIKISYPLVSKVVGPLHKTEVGGVRLNIQNRIELEHNFIELMQIPNATGVLLQPMLNGIEIYIGIKKEENFGHTIVCGMGGIMIEVLKDVSIGLAPLTDSEIHFMISNLKSYPIFQGLRGKKGINIPLFAEIIKKVSLLAKYLPEIEEMDINPLMASENSIVAVDVRMRIKKDC